MPQLSLHTPLGEITLSEEDGAIVALDWGRGCVQEATPLLREARDQLHDYFDGKRAHFQLPLAPHGTPYQRRVWSALRGIPAGETRSYADIAREVASHPRAVGQANGRNPIPIVIPCHRVIAANGAIGGFSSPDGPVTKRYLLALEARTLNLPSPYLLT
ncbi:MAG: methylated-DNA--[protein]-cysteine S-methyltransferase [Roseococcus sp.]